MTEERWAKPVIPTVVEPSASSVWVEDTPDGKVVRGDYRMTLTEEMTDWFREGRACLRCWERQETGFPPWEEQRHLPGCAYDIREWQARDFALEFEGTRHIGPSKPMQDYLDQNYEVKKNPLHFDPRTGRPKGGDFSFKRKGIYVPSSKMGIPTKKRK